MDHDELTALFRKLGASDPEDWAASQIEEGIPQLARYLFLRQAWRQIVKAEVADMAWALVRLDAKGKPIESIPGLHESVLELDPTGRSMRPRGAKA